MNMPPAASAAPRTYPVPPGLRWVSRQLLRSALFAGAGGAVLGVVALARPDEPLAPQTGLFAVLVLVAAVFAGLLAHGLSRERRWTRPGLLAFVAGCAAIPVVVVQQMPTRPPAAAFAGLPFGILLSWWYLYRKRSVVAYYASLADRP